MVFPWTLQINFTRRFFLSWFFIQGMSSSITPPPPKDSTTSITNKTSSHVCGLLSQVKLALSHVIGVLVYYNDIFIVPESLYNLPATPGSEVGKPEKSTLDPSTTKEPKEPVPMLALILPEDVICDKTFSS